jgi:hypothetical protein
MKGTKLRLSFHLIHIVVYTSIEIYKHKQPYKNLLKADTVLDNVDFLGNVYPLSYGDDDLALYCGVQAILI